MLAPPASRCASSDRGRPSSHWSALRPAATSPQLRGLPASVAAAQRPLLCEELVNWKHLGLWSILLIPIFFGCASRIHPPSLDGPEKERLIGYWFGVHEQEGIDGDIQAIFQRKADGTFYVRFCIINNGKPTWNQEESGTWHLDGSLKTTVTTHINGRHLGESRYITDKYLITKSTDSEILFEHVGTGTKFRYIRVKEGFEFP